MNGNGTAVAITSCSGSTAVLYKLLLKLLKLLNLYTASDHGAHS